VIISIRALPPRYRLTMKYLSEMSENQTLVLSSGHPMGYVVGSA